jgi:putative Holliday junction resolvase
MIFNNYKDFPRVGRIIGLDWGERRCGVAISDFDRNFVFVRPQINIKSRGELVDAVLCVINHEDIVGIVIGLPLYSDGTDSETTTKVRDFAKVLSEKTDLPIIFIEENLTSSAAQEEMERTDIKKIKQELDSLSARIILENAIDVLKRI